MAADAVIEYAAPETLRSAAAQRLTYGRAHAANRVAGRGPLARTPYVVFSLALPLILLLRQSRQAARAGLSSAFWRSLPRTSALDAAWSAGEMLGYAAGPPKGPQLR